jgi:hypothetical protein
MPKNHTMSSRNSLKLFNLVFKEINCKTKSINKKIKSKLSMS